MAGKAAGPISARTIPAPRSAGEGLGSGVVLAKKGLVVTNFHLCKTDTVSVRLLDGRTLPAKVLKKNFETNLAVLRVELPAGVELVAAACHADDDVVLGETVLAVGNPTGVLPVVTAGVLSALRGNGRLQADPNLGNPNGGGACIDACGRVLGIADAGMIDPLDLAFATRGDKVDRRPTCRRLWASAACAWCLARRSKTSPRVTSRSARMPRRPTNGPVAIVR